MLFRFRFLRALCAIGLCVAMLGIMVSQRNGMLEAERLTRFDVTTDSFKISEAVYEGTQLLFLLRAFRFGTDNLADVRLQFDVLWSRLDVILAMNLTLRPKLQSVTEDFLSTLKDFDAIIYSELQNEDERVRTLKEAVDKHVIALRSTWISEFNRSQIDGLYTRHSELAAKQRKFELAIFALLGVIVSYLLAEIYFATAAQRREKDLRQMAMQASRAKSAFIATVSHEIRTPLNGILGMAHVLSESNLDSEQSECLRVLSDAGGVLLSTINDVLDLSKIEAGQIVVQSSDFSLQHIVDTAAALYAEQARNKNLRLEVNLPDKPLPMLHGDARRLRQILHNLVSNALKFTQQGSVTIRARYYEARGMLILTVTDTGTGIAPEDQALVFEPFGQTDASMSREQGGTGLGLSISRDLCRAMGGELLLFSTPGKGSRFEIRMGLPRAQEPDTVPDGVFAGDDQADAQSLKVKTVLVVDDNKTNRLILRKFLKPLGLDLDEAENGHQAVDLAHDRSYDVILMDVQMPGMDGIEATKRIRSQTSMGQSANASILGVTANVLPDQVELYLEAGMDEVLAKPVSKAGLIEAIQLLRKQVGDSVAVS